ncbi:MAG: BadF/BadG/BcrA/BcrD ATPase family protein [bacterium]|nr:BadF/BadG/BcrA/BcrD ATPase family protein [bacterium]
MSNQQHFVLGIDAGATKTAAAIGNDKHIIGKGRSGPANIHINSSKDIKKHIQLAIRQALKNKNIPSRVKFSHVVVGMAGIDSASDQQKAEAIVLKALQRRILQSTDIEIINDIKIVRRSGSDKKFGIAIISGTGSHGYGVSQTGKESYVGGLEYIMADEGSGYEIGLKGLKAATKSADGRTKPTNLQSAILKHFQQTNIRNLVPIIYAKSLSKSDIAKISFIVEDAAGKNDWRAKQILQEAIDELLLNVETLSTKLDLKKSEFDLVVAGGSFKMAKYPFLKKFKTGVKKIAPHANVISPDVPPVWGAVLLAQDKLKK